MGNGVSDGDARGAREGRRSVFVHGLSGAVGQAVVALAKLRGVNVFGTRVGPQPRCAQSAGRGSIGYTDKRWIAAMQNLGGVDAVFDPLGFESFDESESILRRGGILVAYGMNGPGFAQQSPPRHFLVEFFRVLAKNLKVWSGKRATFFGLNRKSKYYLADLRTLLGLLERRAISVPIKRVSNSTRFVRRTRPGRRIRGWERR